MRFSILAFAALLTASPGIASAATAIIDLDATQNTSKTSEAADAIAGGELISLDMAVGNVSIDLIDGTFQAFRFGSNPIDCSDIPGDCGDGWTIGWKFFDSSGSELGGGGIAGTYETALEALGVAQAQEGTREFFISEAGTYFFAVADGRDSRGDNDGGISLSVDYTAPTAIPLPASAVLLLAGLGGLSLLRRRSQS